MASSRLPRSLFHLSFLPILSLAAAASGSAETEGEAFGAEIWIENASQYELVELRVHETRGYLTSANLLDGPLEIGGGVEYRSLGLRYVTYFREKFDRGPIVAFTTAWPIEVVRGRRYLVTVLDQSFRVEEVELEDLPPGGCRCVR